MEYLIISSMDGIMKVLHCIHSLAGGGAERQIKLLVEEANNQGEEYAIFCVNDKGNNLPNGLVKLYKSANISKISVFKEIQKAIDDFKPEVVHAWLPSSITIPAMIIAKKNSIPVVFSYRNAMKFSRPLMVVEYIFAWLCAKGIVSNNPIEASKIQYRLLYKRKINKYIPNAVKIDSKYKKIDSRSEPKKTILFVGRLTAQKNWQCLLNALPEVINDNPNIQVLVCGDGEDKTDFIALVKTLGLDDYVELRGYEKNVYQVMKDAEVMVLPSWYEGMPNVFLEALEIGLPCIVSTIDANINLLNNRKAAFLFNPTQPDQLAEQLNLFLSGTDHSTMVKDGWELSANYTTKKLASNYKHYYRQLI